MTHHRWTSGLVNHRRLTIDHCNHRRANRGSERVSLVKSLDGDRSRSQRQFRQRGSSTGLRDRAESVGEDDGVLTFAPVLLAPDLGKTGYTKRFASNRCDLCGMIQVVSVNFIVKGQLCCVQLLLGVRFTKNHRHTHRERIAGLCQSLPPVE